MRKLLLLVAVLGLAGSLWAADPIIGEWKLNAAKSTFDSREYAPFEQSEVFRESNEYPGGIEMTFKRTYITGSSTQYVKTFLTVEPHITPDKWCERRIEEKTLGIIKRHEWVDVCRSISKDGKTMRQIETGFPEAFENVLIFEKQ